MKICLYSPYIPKHTGGGERYMFDVALSLQHDHQVTIAVPINANVVFSEVKKKYETFLGESLKAIEFVASPLGTDASLLSKLWWTKQWDVLYYLTDGSFFFSLAKKNILHIQFPFQQKKSGLIERLKLANWSIKNTNSTFTKNIIEPAWPVKVSVVHQPQIQKQISDSELPAVLQSKEKIILHVGRFFRQLHSKRQDVIVDAFKLLHQKHPTIAKGWKLVLIGSVEDETYLEEVKIKAKNLSVEIKTTVSREELLDWYKKAAIYWHATGYGVDQNTHPEKVEHFGISTGEAMSFGCAPIVINKGGQPEVVGVDLKHLLWDTIDQCVEITASLLHNKTKRIKDQKTAHKSIQRFSPKVFKNKLEAMIEQ